MRLLSILIFLSGFGLSSLRAANTQITDTIYYANGKLGSCTYTIFGPTVPSTSISSGSSITPSTYTYYVSGGVFTVSLHPNDDLTPANTSYRVTHVCKEPNPTGNTYGAPITETWIVSTSVTPLKIKDVVVSSSVTPTSQIVPAQITLANGALIYGSSGHGMALTKPVDGACYGFAYVAGVPSFTACSAGDSPWTRTGTDITPTVATDTVTLGSAISGMPTSSFKADYLYGTDRGLQFEDLSTITMPEATFGVEAWSINKAGAAVGYFLTSDLVGRAWIALPGGVAVSLHEDIPGSGPTDSSYARSVNNSGMVFGYIDNGHCWIRSPVGVITIYAPVGATTCTVSGSQSLNSGGDSVGRAFISASHAFVRTAAGTITDFHAGIPGSPDGSAATGINDSGVIVGYATFSASDQAFVRSAGGTVTNFHSAIPGSPTDSRAVGINASGQIVGFAIVSGNRHAIIRATNGTVTDFHADIPGNPVESEAFGISDAGVVVGWMDQRNAFIRSADGVVTLVPRRTKSKLRSINTYGVAVGEMWDTQFSSDDVAYVVSSHNWSLGQSSVSRRGLLNPGDFITFLQRRGTISLVSASSGTVTFAAFPVAPICTITPSGSDPGVRWWVTSTITSVTLTVSESVTKDFVFQCGVPVAYVVPPPSPFIEFTTEPASLANNNALSLDVSNWSLLRGITDSGHVLLSNDSGKVAFTVPSPSEFVNYFFTAYTLPMTGSVSIQIDVSTLSGSPTFEKVSEPGNTCSTPPTVRPYIATVNLFSDGPYDRWWAVNPYSYELAPGTSTITAPLDPANWTSAYGIRADSSPEATAGFNSAIMNPSFIGMTFGGGCFFGHGVWAIGGTAKFKLLNVTVG